MKDISDRIHAVLTDGSGAAQESKTNLPAAPSPEIPIAPERYDLRPSSANYSQSKGFFPITLSIYKAKKTPSPSFVNAPRINQLLQNGNLMLGLDDAIALALENNLDLAIARYNLDIGDTDLLRSKSGSTIRGVSTGLVTGTPGGGGGGVTGAGGGGPVERAPEREARPLVSGASLLPPPVSDQLPRSSIRLSAAPCQSIDRPLRRPTLFPALRF